MAKNEKALDPFDIINSELNGTAGNISSTYPVDIPANSTAANTTANPLQTAEQQAEENNNEGAEGSGCIGYIAKGALILFLAAVLAWIIFMPSGSLSELKDHITRSLFSSSTTDSGHDFAANTTAVPTTATTATTASTTETTEPTKPTEESTAGEESTTAAAAAGTATTTAATTATVKKTTTTTRKTTTATSASTDAIVLNNAAAPDAEYIYVYLKSQVVVVYDSDDDVRIAFTCSSGKASTPTKTGDYRILTKYRWRLMIGNCYTQYASSFSSGYLFHSIPYNRKNAATMSNASYDKLGSPASAGCIRLCFRDAKWVYDNCPIGTYVRVTDDYAPTNIVTQSIVPRINDTAHSGWDPTDTDPNNPYHG